MTATIDRRERVASALAVAAVHALVGALLIGGMSTRPTPSGEQALATFDVASPAPPPAISATARAPAAEGAAAPPALTARPTAIVAAPLPLPSPVVAAPVAAEGSEAQAGAAPLPGPGTGAGGVGDGLGAGRGGSGSGGGGGRVMRARLLRGAIGDRDYPKAAAKARRQGAVVARFTVGTDGVPRDCSVQRSSGEATLDAATCRLIGQRFRYAPARDANGPVEELRGWRQEWWLERRGVALERD